MNLLLNHVYGIVYKNLKGQTFVFNGRVVAKGTTTFSLKFMNSRGVVIIIRLRKAGVIRAVEL